MKVSTLLRRINRGLVLGGILLVGLVVYLVADSFRFQTEIPKIEQLFRDFAADSAQLMVLPEAAQIPGKPASEEAINAKMEENEEVLRQYLADTTVRRWTSSAYQAVKDAQQYAFTENLLNASYVTDCSYLVTSVIDVKKVSPNLATATVTVKATVDTIGNPSYVMYLNQQYRDAVNSGGFVISGIREVPAPDTDSEEPEIDTERHTRTQEVTFRNVYLKRIDGAWKICEATNMYW